MLKGKRCTVFCKDKTQVSGIIESVHGSFATVELCPDVTLTTSLRHIFVRKSKEDKQEQSLESMIVG